MSRGPGEPVAKPASLCGRPVFIVVPSGAQKRVVHKQEGVISSVFGTLCNCSVPEGSSLSSGVLAFVTKLFSILSNLDSNCKGELA